MNDEIKEILESIQYAIDEDDYWEVTKETLKPLLDYITNLQKTNKNHSKKLIELGNKITNLQQEKEDYKSRCEKAIKYIKENKVKTYAPYGDNEDTDYDICLVEREINELLNILQNGSEKDE